MIFESFKSVYDDGGSGKSDNMIDYNQDYAAIWDTFKAHRNVDLNKDEINWIDFTNMLHGILLEGVGSLCKILEFRAYEQPPTGKNAGKKIAQKEHQYRVKMKTLYRIRREKKQERAKLDKTLHNIMDYFKGRRKRGS